MKTAQLNLNHDPNPPASNQDGQPIRSGWLDLSRGARHYHLEPQNLWLAVEVWEEYGEVNWALGLNVAGEILSGLAGQYAYCPEGMSEGVMRVALRRRKDDELVEVELQIHRVAGGAKGSLVLLRKVGEGPLGSGQRQQMPDNPVVREESRGGGGGDKTPARWGCRWKFCLQDDPPGPSVGDAAEFIEGLGMDPWSFEKLELSDEWWEGMMAVSEFEVMGTPKQLEALRAAWRRQTGQMRVTMGRSDEEEN